MKSLSILPNARDVFPEFFVGRDNGDAEEARRTAVVKCKKTVEVSAAGDKVEDAIQFSGGEHRDPFDKTCCGLCAEAEELNRMCYCDNYEL